eukprot:s1002_g7.t1
MWNATLVVETTALISMVTRYMSPTDDMVVDERVASVERIASFLHEVLQRVGVSFCYQSMMFTWQSLSRSLAIFEERLFPGLPIQTPQAIATPGVPRNMGVLLSDDFQELLPRLEPAWDSLLSLIDWISDGYDRNTHLTVFQALEDSALLLESIGHLHRVDLLNTHPWVPAPDPLDPGAPPGASSPCTPTASSSGAQADP